MLTISKLTKEKINYLTDKFFDKKVSPASHNIILEVPFHEKDQVKSLGAKWNPQIKKWFILEGADITPFLKWIPGLNKHSLIIKPLIYLLESSEECYRCAKRAAVFAIASDCVIDKDTEIKKFIRLYNIQSLPDHLELLLKTKIPTYYKDYTRQSDSYYFVNHCDCGAKLGDFYLHTKPGSAFFPTTSEQAMDIFIYELPIKNELEIKASYMIDNYLFENAVQLEECD
jgi:hypothetical protein